MEQQKWESGGDFAAIIDGGARFDVIIQISSSNSNNKSCSS
jgi:hypothetical protein